MWAQPNEIMRTLNWFRTCLNMLNSKKLRTQPHQIMLRTCRIMHWEICSYWHHPGASVSLTRSCIIHLNTFESSRPPTLKCGNLFKVNTCLMMFECQSKVTGSDCSNISVAMSRIRWICLNSLMFGTTLGAVLRVSGRRIHVGRVALLHAMMTTPSPTWRCHACSPEPWRNYATFFLGI